MRIDCESCGKALQVPDDKVPDRVFSLTCPGCQNKITVDPNQGAEAPAPAPAPSPAPAAAAAAAQTQTQTQAQTSQAQAQTSAPAASAPGAQPAGGGDADDGEAPLESTGSHAVGGLRNLRSNEVELLEQITPLAIVVDVDVSPDPAVDAQLKLAGMKEIQHVSSLSEAVERAEELEAGMLVIRMSKAPPPPCEPLDPLYRMPTRARRKTFTVLLADNVRTLDGQVAFYLQVNCLINAQEKAGMAVPLRRALLFDLKHYRHWWDTQEGQ